MTPPKASFVVPCFKLAHVLRECLESILSQTCRDFEVLVMDDCSPDDVAEVVRSLDDPRVKHIRNEINLGHLQNYNKGISLAQGLYIWLISADDRLRASSILEQYVRLMDSNSRIGFTCCAGMELRWNGEERLATYSSQASHNKVFEGRSFLCRLLKQNTILASSGMVRRDCYDRLGAFPLDMPYAGDWYLWGHFALHYDVGYFAEPMVSYRIHELSMTNAIAHTDPAVFIRDDLSVLWRLKNEAESLRARRLVTKCREQIALRYARASVSVDYGTSYGLSRCALSLEECEQSVEQFASSLSEVVWMKACTLSYIGDHYYRMLQYERAEEYYRQALDVHFRMPKVWLKRAVLAAGPVGTLLRKRAFAIKRALATR